MSMQRTLAVSFIVVGFSLVIVSLLGDYTSFGAYTSRDASGDEQFEESLVESIHSVEDLVAFSFRKVEDPQLLSDEQKMLLLYEAVINRFTHSRGARHTLGSNWILYCIGRIMYPLGFIWDHTLFLAKGHSLICSQSSYLLMQVALQNGIVARHVGLNGHVVMEAWYDNDWHMFDPDREIIIRDRQGTILSVEEISIDMELMKKKYAGDHEDLIPIIASREDNSFISYPPGCYFEWKSQVLLYVEKCMQYLKYCMPLLFILFGSFMLLKSRRYVKDNNTSTITK